MAEPCELVALVHLCFPVFSTSCAVEVPDVNNILSTDFSTSFITLEGGARVCFFHVTRSAPAATQCKYRGAGLWNSHGLRCVSEACTEFQQETAKPALKVKYRRDVHVLPKCSAGCVGCNVSDSCLPERGPSAKCLVTPHTFGRLFGASVSAHIANPSGIGSPGQVTWEQGSPQCSPLSTI